MQRTTNRPMIVILAIVLFQVLTVAPGVHGEDFMLHSVMRVVKPDTLQHYVDVLADDSFEGRAMGSRGGQAAAGWLVRKFQQDQLQPAGADGSFFQSFEGGGRNILAMLEGSDPILKKQVIVVGAHYDHVGYGSPNNSYGPIGRIHHGADDNASGVSGLLQTIEAVNLLPEHPKRTIIFALWDGEEKGLLGSKYWLDHPTVDRQRIVLGINMDMIGRLRNNRVEVYGCRSAPGLRQLVSQQNQETALQLDFTWEMKANSDHYTFYEHRIPTLMLHTGLHSDYHRPSDEAQKIQAEGMQKVVRLLVSILTETANAEQLPAFRLAATKESPANQAEFEPVLPPTAGRLGIRWRDETAKGQGLRVTDVASNSPAARAGLLPGDQLTSFAGLELDDEMAFRLRVMAVESQAEIVLRRPPNSQPKIVTVKLDGKPVRLGITWRTSDAEPHAVALTRVIPSSPADLAGLKVNDRIYRVDGHGFGNAEDFAQMVVGKTESLELLVEHQGQLRTVRLEPLVK